MSRHGNAAGEGGTTPAALRAPVRSRESTTRAGRTDSIASRVSEEGVWDKTPSSDTRSATAPASAPLRYTTDPGSRSIRAPFGMDTQRSALFLARLPLA